MRTALICLGCEVEILHCYFASLHATLDLQNAGDSLVVLHTDATSFYVCIGSHLSYLLYCILVKFKLRPAFTFVLILIFRTSLYVADLPPSL